MKRTPNFPLLGLFAAALLSSAPALAANSGVALAPEPAVATQETGPRTSIVFVKYADEKELKSLSKKLPLYRFGEEVAVMGELVIPDGGLKIGAPMNIYVPALAKSPKIGKVLAEAPYEYDKDGEVKVIGKLKKNIVTISPKNQVVVPVNNGQGIKQSILSDFSLFSVCADLEQRRLRVTELKDELKGMKQADDPEAYESKSRQLVQRWDALVVYVEGSVLFREMGVKLRKEFSKGTSKMRDEASDARVSTALEAINKAKPETLELGKDKKLEFHQLESPHIRMVYLVSKGGIDDDYAKSLLRLAEESIEHFRRIAIDPFEEFRKEQEGDSPIIPSGIFQEYFIGPESSSVREELWTEHYGLGVQDKGIFEVMATGTILRRNRDEPLFLAFAKNQTGSLPGWVVHQVGHQMASLHYNRTNEKTVSAALPLIQESVAMHLCFEKLGNNNMRCTNSQKATYENQGLDEGVKKVEVWDTYRDRFFKLSLRAPSFDDCAIVPLNKLNELHMAKGWMNYQYILNHDGVIGQRWLRQCHDSVTELGDGDRTGLDRNQWRKLTEELMGKENLKGDPLQAYEERLEEDANDNLRSK